MSGTWTSFQRTLNISITIVIVARRYAACFIEFGATKINIWKIEHRYRMIHGGFSVHELALYSGVSLHSRIQ